MRLVEQHELDLHELALIERERWASIFAGLLSEFEERGVPLALKVDSGDDFQSDVMGGGAFTGDTGTTATAPTATTFTCDGKSYTTNQLAGHVVVVAGTYGVILSNTGTVLTIDKWYAPASPGGAAASTPAAGQYVILPGGGPAFWMAITADSGAPALGDTTLTGEITTGGLGRKLATYSHTAGANTYALSTTFTQNDATVRVPAKLGVFNATAGGRLVFETLIPNPPTLAAVGDSVTPTDTITTV